MKKLIKILTLSTISLGACVANSLAQTATTEKVWTASEILAERQTPIEIKSPRMCDGKRFKPCVCASDVSKLVQYRPSVAQCGKKAGVVLSGSRYLNVFSLVVRDRENRDRWPLIFPTTGTGYGGCTLAQARAGLGKCSAFKVQKIIRIEDANGPAELHCLGESGYHPLMKGISRITVKIKDIPGSNQDPLERLCLAGATKPLN